MPMYEYACCTCGITFEKLRRIQDDDSGVRCPDCGSATVERRISASSIAGCGNSGSSRFR